MCSKGELSWHTRASDNASLTICVQLHIGCEYVQAKPQDCFSICNLFRTCRQSMLACMEMGLKLKKARVLIKP